MALSAAEQEGAWAQRRTPRAGMRATHAWVVKWTAAQDQAVILCFRINLQAHLRPRTNTIGAVARIRNALAYATHSFFQVRHFPVESQTIDFNESPAPLLAAVLLQLLVQHGKWPCPPTLQENGFLYVHTPIITASDAEGAGEMFQVRIHGLEPAAASWPQRRPCAHSEHAHHPLCTTASQTQGSAHASAR